MMPGHRICNGRALAPCDKSIKVQWQGYHASSSRNVAFFGTLDRFEEDAEGLRGYRVRVG